MHDELSIAAPRHIGHTHQHKYIIILPIASLLYVLVYGKSCGRFWAIFGGDKPVCLFLMEHFEPHLTIQFRLYFVRSTDPSSSCHFYPNHSFFNHHFSPTLHNYKLLSINNFRVCLREILYTSYLNFQDS